ncbi:Phage repressor protein C, contains Cro/C1-type HTH and peptisase s24 domains [Apibacter mensalis]|uniref:Phage repressor protein C, contains Cro/C1-type HTH and peptisase s24 domains n=1 Tax=Apibacter mensalis TaxID=1586267 RepID=A0A0X3ARJ8_9FLAO|nr:S24 family peptidase [Apibacter mensalis]CVK17006.1 Phage repressor protein C, contains Cro/C1-type HTH and peptisase s24 domains [Apibacter mensalis]
MKKNTNFFERITELIHYKRFRSVHDFAINGLGYSSSEKLNRLKKEGTRPSYDILEDIANKFDDINVDWLLTGRESMLKRVSEFAGGKEILPAPIISMHRKTIDTIRDIQDVPLYDLEATSGLVELFKGSSGEAVLDRIRIPGIANCDGGVYVKGDSMYPLLKSGDIVLYKKVNLDKIFWGEMYLLSIKIDDWSEYITVKFVQKSDLGDEYIKLVSQNQHHQPKDMLMEHINAIALIRASIRLHN